MEIDSRPALLRDQVVEILRDEILHRCPLGGSMPSEPDLVRQLKVLRNTVRAAYAELEAQGLIKREQGRGTFVIAKTPRRQRTGDVALLFYTSARQMFLVPFYSRLIGEICGRAAGAKCTLSLLTHDIKRPDLKYDWQEHAVRLEEAAEALAIGVFKPQALKTLAQKMPLVAVDSGGPFPFCDSVVANDCEAGRLATTHLLELGHKRIAFLGDAIRHEESVPDPAHISRYEGYLAAMQQGQVWYSDDLLIDTQGSGDATYRAVSAAVARLDRPTAFVCVDDGVALSGIDAAKARGLRVPEDVSFVGVGDVTPRSSKVRLTTIGLQPERIGQVAVEVLLRRLREPSLPMMHEVIPVELLERETTAPVNWS